ncbi:hypothetical protein ABENE_21270 [Asticcacaulis benevestitus DSM 16100 = ATCC BAA-896]|uniref:HTH gntR-type domain-containing protein n=2 Tax=Asticcacaulis TaxID=76890 RepID=V4P4A0_9CAUL|nr:GntR family transcriptional regulator [Asticcacaulis benevestitus]ESQ81979.1 hypothetical protein ABENE_21270 [Asticcacaulis benevestitus DSM 16100 = ATCC BAA-896]
MNRKIPANSAESSASSLADIVGRLGKDEQAPLYLQVQRILREAINNRLLDQNEVIPTERDLAKALDVSRITIRKAIDGLVTEGLLSRRHGARTFVAMPVGNSSLKLTSFTEDMISRGRKPHSEWISKAQGKVTPDEAIYLGLSPDTMVYRFRRVRFADEKAVALEYTTLLRCCLPSLECVTNSVYEALGKIGQRPVRALQRMRAVNFTCEQADRLGAQLGDAGFFIERLGFLQDGRACEFTRSYYRGDAYDIVAELNDLN